MSFPADQVFCLLDYETFSEVDLKRSGGFEYAVHPSTEVLCVAWATGTREQFRGGDYRVYSWCPHLPSDGSMSIQLLLSAFEDPDVILGAHNAYFEQVITRYVLARRLHTQTYLRSIPPSRWLCTASMAAAVALPRKLEHTAAVLKLEAQKDMAGHRLMQKMSKPRKPTKNNPATRHLEPEDLQRLVQYCRTDIETEAQVFATLPMLTPLERRIWELDQRINLHGFAVDRPLVQTILRMIDEEAEAIDQRVRGLSDGQVESVRKLADMKSWLEREGYSISDLAAGTVEAALGDFQRAGEYGTSAAEMLRLRQAGSKTSTAKYLAFEQRSRHDGRLRDILMYHGASTGRWTARGVQPQNFPRGTLKAREAACALNLLRDGELDMVRLVYGDPMEIFSSCIRGMIVAPDGCELDVADYAAIETRILFWAAGHQEGLRAFRENRKLYEEMAGDIFGVPWTSIGKESLERHVGKSAILGCGYGLGAKRFATQYDVAEELAEKAVKTYRRMHSPVPRFWSAIEGAAISAVNNPGKTFTVGPTAWTFKGRFLFCRLPSGRRLAYYGPTVHHEASPWGDPRAVLYHWGEDSVTRKWVNAKTWGGTLVENVIQAISRDLMAEAMLRIDAAGHWRIVLTVHDELAAERRKDAGVGIKEFIALMEELPPWAKGAPVKAEGWTGERYRK